MDDDIAVVEQATEDALVDVDALHLIHVHLDGVPVDEAALEDDPAIGDGDFGGQPSEPCPHHQYEPSQEHQDGETSRVDQPARFSIQSFGGQAPPSRE